MVRSCKQLIFAASPMMWQALHTVAYYPMAERFAAVQQFCMDRKMFKKLKLCSGMHLSKLHFARFSAKKRLNAQPPAYLLHSLLYIL
jgi:hypothetical protein